MPSSSASVGINDIDSGNCWLIYAMGGGWGHLTRSIALARVVASKYRVKIISNSPYVGSILSSPVWQGKDFAGLEIVKIDSDLVQENPAGLSPAKSLRRKLEILIEQSDCACFIVDTFPRGILGELPELMSLLSEIPRILVHRDIDPDYASKYDLRSFVKDNYDLLINPGEGQRPPLADLSIQTSAWLVYDRVELEDRNMLRQKLGISEALPFVLVCASGKKEELPFYAQVTQEIKSRFPVIQVRCLSANAFGMQADELRVEHWPGIDVIHAADFVVGSGGYNTVSECLALGRPLIAFPQMRLYDRQSLRVESCGIRQVASIPELIQAIELELSANWKTGETAGISLDNGALEAFRLIEQVLNEQSY